MIEPFSGTTALSDGESILRQKQAEFEREKVLSLQNLKIKAKQWKNGIISNQEFSVELITLQQSKLIHFSGIESDDFSSGELVIPSWGKDLVGFWLDNLINDEEFLLALKYILEQQAGLDSTTYQ